jgi:hypothetical protein
MNDKHRAAAALAAALVIAGPAGAAAGATAIQAAAKTPDIQLADSYVGWMTKVFAVPATPEVEPWLRDAMTTLAREHLARLHGLLRTWIAEERAHAGASLAPADLDRAIHNRIVNEIALWRLESPGPDYDAVLMRAIMQPGICDRPARDSYLGVLMVWFQAVPTADRPTLLAGERTLLAHWGTRRPAMAPRPAKSLSDDEAETIARLRSGDAQPDAAMPPVLANAAFKGELDQGATDVTCALHQWGLAHALRRGDPAPVALQAWRYASIRTATDWAAPAPADAAKRGPADYPIVAQQFGVSGAVDVRVTPDAQGRFASAGIAGRHLEVPGVTDNPPVAFETLFDSASIAGAPLRFKPVTPHADGSPPGTVTMRIEWTLQ